MRPIGTWFDFPVTAALAVAAIAATTLGASSWTGPLVHATTGHLVRDVAVLLVVGIAYERPLGRRFLGLVAALLVVPSLAVFAVHPHLDAYYGLSGLTHGLIAAALVHELRSPAPAWYARWVGLAFAGKLVFEGLAGTALFPMDLGTHVRQVPIAHLAGAAAGALLASPSRVRSGPLPCDPDRA